MITPTPGAVMNSRTTGVALATADKRVARELDAIIAWRGKPGTIVSDNGTELTSNAILGWVDSTRVGWHYIAPGKPQQTPSSSASTAACATSF